MGHWDIDPNQSATQTPEHCREDLLLVTSNKLVCIPKWMELQDQTNKNRREVDNFASQREHYWHGHKCSAINYYNNIISYNNTILQVICSTLSIRAQSNWSTVRHDTLYWEWCSCQQLQIWFFSLITFIKNILLLFNFLCCTCIYFANVMLRVPACIELFGVNAIRCSC